MNNTALPRVVNTGSWTYTPTAILIESIMLSVLSLCILLGNGLVCIAFVTERKLQTTTNCFVVSLAASDILVGVVIIPMYLFIKNEKILFNQLTYEVWLNLEIVACSSSIVSLVAISIERCLSVKFPAFHHNISRRIVHISLAVVWIYSIFFSGALLNWYNGGKRAKWMAIYRAVMAFVLPLAIIVVAYSFIFKVAISRGKRHQSSLAKEFRIAMIIALVVGAFVCSWLPFFILTILATYRPYTGLNWAVALLVVKWLHYLNSVVNPIIYTCRNQDFRKAFTKLLSRFIIKKSQFDTRLISRSRSDSRHESRTEKTALRPAKTSNV